MRNLTSVILLIISFSTSSFSQVYNQLQKIIASDRASGDVFGFAVSVSGSYAIVGAQYEAEDPAGINTLVYAGSAYIFEKDNNGHWVQTQKIVPSDRTSNDYFGGAVSISGNRAIVGAYEKNAIGANSFSHAGAAYIFERDGNGIWNEVKKIVASDTGATDHFGYSVSISGDHAIVGSPIDGEDVTGGNTLASAGAAYMFERDGNGNWSQTQKIVPADRAGADLFGASVSISSDYAIVGAYQEDENPLGGNTLNNAGSAYIFQRDGNNVWNQTQKIVSSDRAITDRFGISVSINGTYLVVGAYLEDENETGGSTLSNAGSAYIFERDGNNNWVQVKKITSSDRDPNDNFGQSVNIKGNYVIVGAQHEAADVQGGNIFTSAGAAYIFKRNGNGNWNQTQKIVASDRANSDYFGFSVAISADYAFVGAYLEDENLTGGNSLNGAGSSYIFEACQSTSSTINKTVCSEYTSPSGIHTWEITGTYMDTIPNATGCDSVITIHLTINNSSSSIYPIVCDSYTSPSGNYTWTSTGVYNDIIPSFLGCDSIIAIYLTVNNSSATINVSVCDSYTSPSGKYIWTSANTYLDTIPNAQSCDSIITINLIISSSSSTINRTVCNSYTSPSGNYVWTVSNTYMDTIPNAKSCDSVITIHLTINTLPTSSTMNHTACISYISPSGKYNWTAAGTYLDTIPNTEGCDSIITINLTINTISTSSTMNQTVCNSYTSPSGNNIWTSSDTYLDTIPNAAGCDSVITINLLVNSTHSTISETTCSGYTSPSGNHTWASSGIYMDTIPNAAACDSIITIDLTISNSGSMLYQTVCNSYTSPSGNYTWTSSNIYYDTIPNAVGCDSVIVIHLTVNTVSTGPLINQTACNSFTSPSGNFTWTSSNTYYDTIPNSHGCDSLLVIDLTINNVDVLVSQNGTTLTSNISGDSYQWLNCDNGNSIIPGEVSQYYTATTNGNYAVVLTENGCTDTSICYTVVSAEVLENTVENGMSIFPNPANTALTISFELLNNENSVIELISGKGQIVYSQTVENSALGNYNLEIKTDDLANGIYFIVIQNGSKQLNSKIIIDK
ncbi:MAG: T9SS type A sorting domain-containing protein [Bacteroidota bacterium]